jgi:solute:Na+ symporter, SSS family
LSALDWVVLVVYLVAVVAFGFWTGRGNRRIEDFFLAGRQMRWWAVGLSVMATQISAVTFIGTTGQAYTDGMRFLVFYFGLPFAMVILCVTVVPFFYRARVYTAYEYLERRFDARTRTLTSLLFLLSRGLSVGVTLYAPSLVLSVILGWSESATILIMGGSTIVYVVYGGNKSVIWTDVVQMAIIWIGIFLCFGIAVAQLPEGFGLRDALALAQTSGRLRIMDTSPSLTTPYTLWSGLIGGLFLMLSYFGCDQSQVQRYLTAKSVEEGRSSLFISAYVKIPLQALILLAGVLVFTHYLFVKPPMLFNPVHESRVRTGGDAARYEALEADFDAAFTARRDAAASLAAVGDGDGAQAAARERFLSADARMLAIRKDAVDVVKHTTGDTSYTDVNYVFPTFVTTGMPMGLVGLMIAAIFAAAMSAIGAELNALSTATLVDIYRRWLKPEASDRHYLLVSRAATAGWALVACSVALYAARLGSLIEVVNRFGSFFYGSLLGVFVLAIGTKRATGTGAFVGLIAGMCAVAFVAFTYPSVSFLWHNVIGVTVVTLVGLVISEVTGSHRRIGA